MVFIGTTWIVLGTAGGELYLEAHPSLRQAAQLEKIGAFDPEPLPEIEQKIFDMAGDQAGRLDWTAIASALDLRQGIPVQITRAAGPAVRQAEAARTDAPSDVSEFLDSMLGRVFGAETTDN